MLYKTKHQDIHIGSLIIGIQRIANFDEVIEHFFEQDEDNEDYRDERLPYWADLWHSAVALGRFIEEHPDFCTQKIVHEIGCGLGFSGIVAGQLGAQIIFSDYLPDAVDFADRNWSLNSDSPARFEVMDWRDPNPDLKADVLLAADVAYERTAFEPLLLTFETLLRPNGTILISEPGRVPFQDFLSMLSKRGFSFKKHLLLQPLDGTEIEIGVYEIWRD